MSATHIRRSSTGLRLDIAFGTGFVLEAGVYCIYTCLFIAALPGLTNVKRRKDANSRRSGWVFLTVSVLMYLVATLHIVFTAFRFYKSIFSNIDPRGPISYLRNYKHWEYVGILILLSIQTWLGDALVIYRCYFIWNNNLLLISIPVCLLCGQIGVDMMSAYWLRNPSSLSLKQAQRLDSAIYPLAFAQNFMTTSLILLKILLQYRASRKADVVDIGSKLSLIRVVRILIESAAIYTIQILVLTILDFRRDNFQYALQAAVTPSIGITFVLLAIRIEASRNDHTKRSNKRTRISLLPWSARHNVSAISSGIYGDCESLPHGDGGEVEAHHTLDTESQSEAENSWDLKSSSNSAEPSKATSATL